MGEAVPEPFHADEPEDPVELFLPLGHTPALHLEREGDVLRHRAMREQKEVLEHHADAAQIGRQPGHVGAADLHPAAIGRLQAGNDAQQRGLARTAGPQQRKELAAADLEAYAVDGANCAEALLDRLDAQDGLVAHPAQTPAIISAAMCRAPSGRNPARRATIAREGPDRWVRSLCTV